MTVVHRPGVPEPGTHSCMGSHLARAGVTAFLGQLLERGLRIAPTAEPDRLHTNQFHAFQRLQVEITGD